MKSFVISDHQRKLLFVSHLLGGSVHDYGMMTSSSDPALFWFNNLTVRLDLGFFGAEKNYGISLNTIVKSVAPMA